MNKKHLRILSLALAIVLMATLLSSCDFKSLTAKETVIPTSVNLKTDLKDAKFTFTYGELKNVLPPDKLATQFEDYEEKTDDCTVELSYFELTGKYGDSGDIYEGMMNLLSAEEKAMLTANSEVVLQYFLDGVNKAKSEKPIVEYTEKFWVDNDSVKFSQDGTETDEKVAAAAKFFSDFAAKGIGDYDKGYLKKGTTEKGDDLTDILYLLGSDEACKLTSDDVISVISSVSEEKETYTEKEQVTDEKGKESTEDVEKSAVTAMTRTIEIILKDNTESVEKAFSIKEKSPILEEMKKGSDYFKVDDYNIGFKACKITATFDAATDEILTLNYDKNMVINTAVTGVGSLDYLGVQDLEFNCTDNMYYHFGWDSEAK